MLNVLIIDNDVTLHNTYKSYFEKYTDFNLIALHTTIEAALCAHDGRSADIIISEVDFEKMNGIEGIKFFRKNDPNVKILIASANNDFEIIKSAFKNGANGFLTKEVTGKRLHQALLALKNEGAALSNDVAKKIIAMFQPKSYRAFSERENQIIDYLSQGATYKTIADKLFVTTSAINFHIQNIYLKLNVNSKSEALMKLQEIE
ncbi:MAG: response regulator transcription factor [Maribacter sp.]